MEGICEILEGSIAATCDVDSDLISLDVSPPITAPTVETTEVSQEDIEPNADSARSAKASSWLSVQLVNAPI